MEPTPSRLGRTPATTHGELSHTALALFRERGFESTTVNDIVEAAGISRRTFFRYFRSKNDLPWGDFDGMLSEMRSHLAELDDGAPLMQGLRQVILRFNDYPTRELPMLRSRMELLLKVPALSAYSTLRYASWRSIVAEHVAQRRGEDPDDLVPQSIAWVCLGLCLSAFEQWLARDGDDLIDLLTAAFDAAEQQFTVLSESRATRETGAA